MADPKENVLSPDERDRKEEERLKAATELTKAKIKEQSTTTPPVPENPAEPQGQKQDGFKNHYEVLDVPQNAKKGLIRDTYQKKYDEVMASAIDQKEKDEKIKELYEAQEVLLNKEKRAEHDKNLAEESQKRAEGQKPEPVAEPQGNPTPEPHTPPPAPEAKPAPQRKEGPAAESLGWISAQIGAGISEAHPSSELLLGDKIEDTKKEIQEKIQNNEQMLKWLASEEEVQDVEFQEKLKEKTEHYIDQKKEEKKKGKKGPGKRTLKLTEREQEEAEEKAIEDLKKEHEGRLKKWEGILGSIQYAVSPKELEQLKEGVVPSDIQERAKEAKAKEKEEPKPPEPKKPEGKPAPVGEPEEKPVPGQETPPPEVTGDLEVERRNLEKAYEPSEAVEQIAQGIAEQGKSPEPKKPAAPEELRPEKRVENLEIPQPKELLAFLHDLEQDKAHPEELHNFVERFEKSERMYRFKDGKKQYLNVKLENPSEGTWNAKLIWYREDGTAEAPIDYDITKLKYCKWEKPAKEQLPSDGDKIVYRLDNGEFMRIKIGTGFDKVGVMEIRDEDGKPLGRFSKENLVAYENAFAKKQPSRSEVVAEFKKAQIKNERLSKVKKKLNSEDNFWVNYSKQAPEKTSTPEVVDDREEKEPLKTGRLSENLSPQERKGFKKAAKRVWDYLMEDPGRRPELPMAEVDEGEIQETVDRLVNDLQIELWGGTGAFTNNSRLYKYLQEDPRGVVNEISLMFNVDGYKMREAISAYIAPWYGAFMIPRLTEKKWEKFKKKLIKKFSKK